ncbi:hypothetical protein FHY18_004261 [Xanthomonas arboricola]|uniref:hypothetical protein n=1 Tax=Xanthomonas sp. 3793 TaxID=3035312 RepID=UPI002167AA0D|nr:hypothetical protein [Xanthomonas sp. 3793]MCS3748624.1 hypothetical protein [Xanthomonas sp. 3793]
MERNSGWRGYPNKLHPEDGLESFALTLAQWRERNSDPVPYDAIEHQIIVPDMLAQLSKLTARKVHRNDSSSSSCSVAKNKIPPYLLR